MLVRRKRGLLTLYGAVVLALLLLWFALNTLIAAEFIGKINYSQVNYPLYLVGIIIAVLLIFRDQERRVPYGRGRTLWLNAVRQANGDALRLAAIIFGLYFTLKDTAISRAVVAWFLIGSWVILIFSHRFLLQRLLRTVFRGANVANTVLVGSVRGAARLEGWLRDAPGLGLKVLGWVPVGSIEGAAVVPPKELPVVGELRGLATILENLKVHQVVLLDSQFPRRDVRRVLDTCERAGARVLIFNHWESYFDQPIEAVKEGDLTFFAVGEEPLQDPFNRLLKRALDIAVSLPVVVFVLPVLTLLVWIMQRTQSPGPLFFRQERGGVAKTTFTILKYRTMHLREEDDEAMQATEGDARIFSFGRFLRRSSLDEFPQFINVLVGQMSVVGPRPHLLDHDEDFARYVDFYKMRQFVKPGITGLAQSHGLRGEITSEDVLHQRVRLDVEYVRNWSIWMDGGIILKTFKEILMPPNTAY